MSISTVTSKGQITIPKRIREKLRLQPGDKLEFQVEDDGSVRIHPLAKRVSEVFGIFASKALKARSTTEMKKKLKKAFKEGRI